MTISTLLMILALGLGSGSSQSLQSDTTTDPAATRTGKIVSHCWINGVWYNPCPSENTPPGPSPEPSPEILLPN